LLSQDSKKELDLQAAQNIFGYFDKSRLIDLFKLILQGDESKVIENYRKIYDQGVEPKIFINDFLEILYYFKNINHLTLESTNFSLNDEEFNMIKEISNNVDSEALILFWQFTIKTLGELDIVSNQHLSIEMFLLRLIHLVGFEPKNEKEDDIIKNDQKNISSQILNKETVNQIKNVVQEKKIKPQTEVETKAANEISINSFNELLDICYSKKEIKLKYELEKNVNLVKFENDRIEISFNDNLDKNFVKDLSTKLLEWTNRRWIISFSKNKGELSIKDKEKNRKIEIIENSKKSDLYKTMIDLFPDAELIDVKPIQKDDE
jgi:DNA polymerase-3 subunit gamma/tau